jgi:predicted transcriptional regulator
LWPTPVANDDNKTPEAHLAMKKRIGERDGTHSNRTAITSLNVMVKQWQTATVSTGAHRQKDGSMIDKLDQQVKNWATPDASDRRSDNCRQIGLSNQTQGKLNPRWVETLMGLPVGWTMPSCVSPVTIERMNSDSSVTVLYQQQPQ